jgi:hypothetical protein
MAVSREQNDHPLVPHGVNLSNSSAAFARWQPCGSDRG